MQTNPTLDLGMQFRRAAAVGDIHKVRSLQDKNLINHTSSNGNTALHWSIENKHYAVTKLLLTVPGLLIDAPNHQGHTPLHLAVKQDDKKTVYRLLKQGAGRKNRIDKEGFSFLDYAFDKSSFIVTKLKHVLPDMTFKNEDKLAEQAYERFKSNNPILIRNFQIFDPNYLFDGKVACYFLPGNSCKLAALKKATAKKILNPHKLFCSGNLLQSAAVSRVETIEKFRWLLEQGVDPNLQASHEINPSSYKNTALHTLIANEDEKDALDFIALLIEYAHLNFNFNLTDSEGKTCLCLAVKAGLFKVAEKLITLGVDVNIPDEDGNTPLHYAFLLGHVSIAAELIKNQSNTHAKNKESKIPYELLISTDIEDVRDCLETIWINPDRKVGHSKKTYLQYCMENREIIANKYLSLPTHSAPQSIQTMAKHGSVAAAGISTDQKRKIITYQVAAQSGDLATIQKNCDVDTLNACNLNGDTPLHLACKYDHTEIVKFLLEQPGIDLHKKNHKQIQAVDLISNLPLANLFKDKLLTIVPKTEHRNDTLSRLNQRKEILSNETMSVSFKKLLTR
ncbi:MAG: ankyrin repeat domain-containing protein [Candidatus Aquirickettsiella sp.]